MSGALFRKEMRSLRPFTVVVLAFLLLELVDVFLSPFGAETFPHRLKAWTEELAIVQIVLGFALGTNLLVREIDDGTLGFLDGLPLRRAAIFGAKIRAALLVLLIFPAGTLLLNVAMHMATRGSLDHALHLPLLLTLFGLCVLLTALALAAGMLLGFLRYLSWLVLALAAIGITLLRDKAPSVASALNTADLLTPRFTGTAWQLPMATIWTQLGAALLFGALAFILFCSAGKVRARVQRIGAARRWFSRIGIAVMVGAALAGTAALAGRSMAGKGGGEGAHGNRAGALEFTPIAGAHAATTHYSFSYPALSGARARALIDGADRTFEFVAGLLGAEGGAPIDVDLSGSTDNHAGTAYLDRIRLRLSDKDAMSTLAHETTHVLAGRLAGGDRSHQLDRMMVFNEGLAEWAENRFDTRLGKEAGKQAGVTESEELAAAIVSARRLVKPRLLTDAAAFAASVDDNLKYPLGAILIDCLVQRYGAVAPKKVLQVLANEDFPRDLERYALWQTAFQLAGFDLDLVLDDYARRLKRLEPAHARQIAALPRPRGSLVEQDDDYLVALRFDLPVPDAVTPVVRYRPGKSADSASYRTRFVDRSDDGTYNADVPAQMVTRGEICFQPGVMVDGIVIYEPWVCLPVASASAD
jgi:ABC-type transport system involved in multi-copper enzyme maturation permease subunit